MHLLIVFKPCTVHFTRCTRPLTLVAITSDLHKLPLLPLFSHAVAIWNILLYNLLSLYLYNLEISICYFMYPIHIIHKVS